MQTMTKIGLFVTGLLLLAACQGNYVSASPEATPTPEEATGLAGTRWVLSSLSGSLPLPGTTVTLEFGADGSVSGTDGCNQFNTSFVQTGSSLTITQPAASTMMACQADVMGQADDYMDALARTTSFSVNQRQLILQEGSQIVATFVVSSQELAGTSWLVTSFNNGREAVVSLIIGSEISADFGTDARVTGNAGCNDFFASFSASNGTISIDTPGSTFRFCDEPPGVMDQESEFLAALASVATYNIQGNQLQMRTADDQLALVMTRRTVVDLPDPPAQPATPWGRATAPRGLNVRSGPGVNFPVLGVALYGDEGEIVGRSADGRWWAVSIPTAPDGIGWVSVDFVMAMNAENVPVVQSPPPPVVVPTVEAPPATPTPVPPPTATPEVQISFSADQTTIDQGQCTTLRWSVENVQAVWVYPQGENFHGFPRTGNSSEQVCPAVTTTYEIRVQQRDGTHVIRELTITVNPSQEPQFSLWADRTTIDQGQCTRLYWFVENVQAVWVYPQGENYSRFPRTGNDSERVCPDQTTTYEMRVLLRDNSTIFRQVTINVNAVATPTPPVVSAADPLADSRWDIVQFNNGRGSVSTLLAATFANVSFDTNGQVSGSAGCNNFTATYQVNGNNITITLGGSTSMLCGEPEGLMDQESEILAALDSAATFTIRGNTLEMRTSGDQIALILQRAP